MDFNRRYFFVGAAALAAQAAAPSLLRGDAPQSMSPPTKFPFHLAVINDEISPDFDHACHVVANVFNLQFIELRGLWGKNIINLTDDEIGEARRILAKYKLTVTDIASPLFKTSFPGEKLAPGLSVDEFGATFTYDRQQEVLESSIHLARSFSTSRIRCFDFTRLADPKPARPEIHEQLRKAAGTLAKDNLILLLENEHTCNTATGAEAAATLATVEDKNFMLNWDPGNAAAAGETPFSNGYDLLPKNRIGHCHCKDVVRTSDGKTAWAAVGNGFVDWRGQIRALIRQKFSHALSLETHWRGAGTAEASTRQSLAGLRKVVEQATA